jgi:hypothetical protein
MWLCGRTEHDRRVHAFMGMSDYPVCAIKRDEAHPIWFDSLKGLSEKADELGVRSECWPGDLETLTCDECILEVVTHKLKDPLDR